MRIRFSLSLAAFILLAGLVRPMTVTASPEGDLEREYAQVRKIALKDPGVQEAFEKANARLDEKILRIDPALKPIVEREKHTPAPVATGKPEVEQHPAAAATATPEGRQHVVVKGETLSSIAARYKVKVASLEKLNHITDDRKLQVGQKLAIPAAENPAAESPEPPAAAETPAPQPKENGGIWDRLKSNL